MSALPPDLQLSPASAALLLVQSPRKNIRAQHVKNAVMSCMDIKMVIINLAVNIHIKTVSFHFQKSLTSQTLNCMCHPVNEKQREEVGKNRVVRAVGPAHKTQKQTPPFLFIKRLNKYFCIPNEYFFVTFTLNQVDIPMPPSVRNQNVSFLQNWKNNTLIKPY